jgi:hypothetical protein
MRWRVGSNQRFRASALAAVAALGACASIPPGPRGLPEFEATLAADDSATAALGQWCARRRIADPATISAAPAGGVAAPTPADARTLLGQAATQPLGYRHVRLSCGGTVLSEAHNWYLPQRLTPAMNTALDTTDTPFGKVAGPLHFTRERLSSRRGRGSGCPAGTILTHRALLRLPDGRALALVVECYTPANLKP